MSVVLTGLLAFFGGGGLAAVVVAYLLLRPEKIQIWSSILWGVLSHIKAFAGFAHKRKVQYDLEGRLNDYIRVVRQEAPYLANSRVKVEWTERNLTKKGFFEDGKVLVRLKRDDPQDTNFVHGVYWTVSTGFLFKAKRYISKPQREAVDLYVTTKVLEQEKPSVRGIFLDRYLHPKTKEPHSKVSAYFDDFMMIDKGGTSILSFSKNWTTWVRKCSAGAKTTGSSKRSTAS